MTNEVDRCPLCAYRDESVESPGEETGRCENYDCRVVNFRTDKP